MCRFYSTWHSSVYGPHLASFLSDDPMLFGLLALSLSESFSICPIPFKLNTYPFVVVIMVFGITAPKFQRHFLYFKNLKSESFKYDVVICCFTILYVHLPSACPV